jgi:hypothetical protein
MNRRTLLTDLLLPLIVSIGGTLATTVVTDQWKERRSLSITVIPSEAAASPGFDSTFLPFGDVPLPTPTPGPGSRYTYVVIVRNDGDFSEENVAISVRFHPETTLGAPLFGSQISWSSPLLADSVVSSDPIESDGYAMKVLRLNPDEWVSLQVGWEFPTEVSVQVRSDSVSASAFV